MMAMPLGLDWKAFENFSSFSCNCASSRRRTDRLATSTAAQARASTIATATAQYRRWTLPWIKFARMMLLP